MKIQALLITSAFATASTSACASGFVIDHTSPHMECDEMRSSPEQFIASIPTFYPQTVIKTTRVQLAAGLLYTIEVESLDGKPKAEFAATDTRDECETFLAGYLTLHKER